MVIVINLFSYSFLEPDFILFLNFILELNFIIYCVVTGKEFLKSKTKKVPIIKWKLFNTLNSFFLIWLWSLTLAILDSLALEVLIFVFHLLQRWPVFFSLGASICGSECPRDHKTWNIISVYSCLCSVAQSCPTLCDPSTPDFPVLHHLPRISSYSKLF